MGVALISLISKEVREREGKNHNGSASRSFDRFFWRGACTCDRGPLGSTLTEMFLCRKGIVVLCSQLGGEYTCYADQAAD